MNATSSPRKTFGKRGMIESATSSFENMYPAIDQKWMRYDNISYGRGAGLLGPRKVILSQSGLMHKLKINGVHNFSLRQGLGGRGERRFLPFKN